MSSIMPLIQDLFRLRPVQEKEKDSVREKSEKESSPPQPAVQEEPVVEPVPTCAVCGMEEVDMRVPDNSKY